MNNLERITTIINFYLERGVNKESVNNIYRKILNQWKEK
jgi:hypothetical protein